MNIAPREEIVNSPRGAGPFEDARFLCRKGRSRYLQGLRSLNDHAAIEPNSLARPGGRPATDGGEAAPAEGAAASEQPGFEPAVPAVAARELPEIAKKADDLEAIKAAVDDAAAVGGGLWLSYVSALLYLAVAAGAVTHQDLFFEHPVKLPFFNVELPLFAFFFLAPILFVVVHAYTLVHLVMLTDKAKRYHQALHDPERNVTDAARENLQWQLPSNIFIQFLAGPPKVRASLFGWLLRAIAWVTLAIAPVLMLLMMQIQFLPYHSGFVTWTLRVALGADLVLIWWLWRKILSGREIDGGRRLGSWLWPPLGLALSLAVLFFSVAVVTFPGEWQEALPSWQILPAMDEWGKPANENESGAGPRIKSFRDWVMIADRVPLHDWLFNAKSDWITRRRFPFSNTLVLPGLNVYEGLGIDDPEKAKWHDFVFRARGRDLRGAIFDFASLPKVDFEGADLQGASLHDAQLQGASLYDAQLQGARLDGAQLQGARLDGAHLRGASLYDAQLQGASLWGAHLQGASLDRAQLQGASLWDAQLQGASLDSAGLQGAGLQSAALEATDLTGAYLWRTNRPDSPPKVTAIRMSGETWLPEWIDAHAKRQPWDDKAYQALRTTIESLPPGNLRDQALERIETLGCASSDNTLASCEVSAATPREAAAWREALEKAARVDDKAYAEALAKVLKQLVCSGGDEAIDIDEAIHVLRGGGFQERLEAAGAAASGLIDDLMTKDSKDCPVAAALTDGDRANLLRVKQFIEPAKKPGG